MYVCVYFRYIWSLSTIPCSRLPKPLEFSEHKKGGWWQIILGLLSSVPENSSGKVTFGSHPRVGAGCQEKQPCEKRVGTFSPTPWSSGRREGLEVESTTIGQWFSQSLLCNNASINTPKNSFLDPFFSRELPPLGNRLFVKLPCWAPSFTRTETPSFRTLCYVYVHLAADSYP